MGEVDVRERLDHLVYSTSSVEEGVRALEAKLGARASGGGQHMGRGTRNALIRLSATSYLEVIGADEAQPGVFRPRWLGVDSVPLPRLFTWAVKSGDLAAVAQRAKRLGTSLGPISSGSRRLPSGGELRWSFTDPSTVVLNGIVPFLIDWGAGPHPAAKLEPGPTLLSLRAEHPEPEAVSHALQSLEVSMAVVAGPRPRLIATFQTSRGVVELA